MNENETRKPRVEVVEETQENLEVLDLDRLPRAEKMAREQRVAEGAHAARFQERAFLPRRQEPLDEVRAAVDALAPKRAEFPEARPPPAPLPPEPEPEPEPPAVPEALRVALEPVVGAPIRSAEVLHHEATGQVVEVTYESGGASARGLYLLTEEGARPFDDIAARVDLLPTPEVPAPEPEPAPEQATAPEAVEEPAALPEEAPAAPEDAPAKKSRFGFRRKKEGAEPADAPAESQEPPAAETPAASQTEGKKGLLGRFGRKKEDRQDAADAPEAQAAPDEAAPPAAGPRKGLLGKLGRKKQTSSDPEPSAEGASDAGAADEEAATAESPAADEPKKRRFGLRRK